MTPDVLTTSLLIFVLSLVQSVFGVGLLVFGTPILMLLGHSFPTALGTLLPCSVVISALQTLKGWKATNDLRKDFLFYTLPFVIVGLAAVFFFDLSYSIGRLVGALLIVTGLIRLFPGLQRAFHRLLGVHRRTYLATMGAVHGLTNMGGGLLTIFVNSIHSEKEKIRANIAFCYLVMALSQLIVLSLIGQVKLGIFAEMAFYLPLTMATYLLFGHAFFAASTEAVYQHAMTVLILTFGVSLMVT